MSEPRFSEPDRLDRLRAWARRLRTEVKALYLATRDPRTPWYAKLVVLAVVTYALSPVDLIPDFVPVLGYLDDLVLLPLGIALAVRLVPAPVLAECRARAQGIAAESRSLTWTGGAIVVGLWLAAAAALAVWAARTLLHPEPQTDILPR